MAKRLVNLKFRCLAIGLLCTFMYAIFWGISLLQKGVSLYTREQDAGFNKGIGAIDTVTHQKGEHSLCILIPFRDRFEELLEFVPYMHDFLHKQDNDHRLIVINQLDRYRFNRASLINVGFLETKSFCDYLAMHDVDLLPVNEELRYDFPEEGPIHLAAPHLHPIYHYKSFVGGILLIQSKHFQMLNGLSNKYWGWGREDDEFFVRMKRAKLLLGRPGNLTTGYKSFKHIHDRRRRPRDQNRYFDQLEKTRRLDKETGVSNVQYAVDSVNELVIDGAPVTVINVHLECNVDVTPWCLRAEDHEWYKQRQEEKHKQQSSQSKTTAGGSHSQKVK